DTWGFGFRQASSGSRMQVVESTRYFHRVGLNSYYVRDERARFRSQVAASILLEDPALLDKRAVRKIYGRNSRKRWFEDLARHGRSNHTAGGMSVDQIAPDAKDALQLELSLLLN
ncbi:MAG: hypothetical protein O2815_12760, partial [Actinomycetota bacterium]|nr:hypothetical protein [Actinomycetota bacterium]